MLHYVALKVVLCCLMLLCRVLVWFRVCEVWSANVKVRVCDSEARANRILLSIASDDNLTFKLQVL
jgi:hypothetical protein